MVGMMFGKGSENALYPEIEYTDTDFNIVFRRSNEYLKMVEEKSVKEEAIVLLNERQKKFIEVLKEKEILARTDYETITETSKRTAIRDLQDLVNKGVIVNISTSMTDPNRRYKLA